MQTYRTWSALGVWPVVAGVALLLVLLVGLARIAPTVRPADRPTAPMSPFQPATAAPTLAPAGNGDVRTPTIITDTVSPAVPSVEGAPAAPSERPGTTIATAPPVRPTGVPATAAPAQLGPNDSPGNYVAPMDNEVTSLPAKPLVSPKGSSGAGP